jgi:hypothetical protein
VPKLSKNSKIILKVVVPGETGKIISNSEASSIFVLKRIYKRCDAAKNMNE